MERTMRRYDREEVEGGRDIEGRRKTKIKCSSRFIIFSIPLT